MNITMHSARTQLNAVPVNADVKLLPMYQPRIKALISGFLVGVAATLAGLIVLALPQLAPYMFLVIGLVLITVGGGKIKKAREKARWPQVPAVLTSVDESEFGIADSQYEQSVRQYLYPVVEYEYEVNGKSLRGTKVADAVKDIAVPVIDNLGSKVSDSDKFWHEWVKGTRVTAYVNPEEPSESVLVPQLSKRMRSHYAAIMVSGVLLLFCWAGLIWAT
jgi:hypothetical protein